MAGLFYYTIIYQSVSIPILWRKHGSCHSTPFYLWTLLNVVDNVLLVSNAANNVNAGNILQMMNIQFYYAACSQFQVLHTFLTTQIIGYSRVDMLPEYVRQHAVTSNYVRLLDRTFSTLLFALVYCIIPLNVYMVVYVTQTNNESFWPVVRVVQSLLFYQGTSALTLFVPLAYVSAFAHKSSKYSYQIQIMQRKVHQRRCGRTSLNRKNIHECWKWMAHVEGVNTVSANRIGVHIGNWGVVTFHTIFEFITFYPSLLFFCIDLLNQHIF